MKLYICFDSYRYLQFYSEKRYEEYVLSRASGGYKFDMWHEIVFLWTEFSGDARYPKISYKIKAAKSIARRMKWRLNIIE